jgi:hypothetical protein
MPGALQKFGGRTHRFLDLALNLESLKRRTRRDRDAESPIRLSNFGELRSRRHDGEKEPCVSHR